MNTAVLMPTAPHALGACVEILVPFHDCDPANIVWHGHYAKYFEVARCAWLEGIGYNYDQMAAGGHLWPLVDYSCRFIKMARFNQRISVSVRLLEWQFRLKLEYLITDALSGERIAKGKTVQVAVGRDSLEMLYASPDILRKALGIV